MVEILETRALKTEGRTDGLGSQDLFLWSQVQLLNGFAVENMIKGLLVQAEPDRFNEKVSWDYVDAGGHGHGLLGLALAAKVEVSSEEAEILDLLEKVIVWSGRYPTQKKHEGKVDWTQQMLPKFTSRAGAISYDQFQSYNEALSTLVNKIYELFQSRESLKSQ